MGRRAQRARIRREKRKRKETLFERGREGEREEMRECPAGRGDEDRAQGGKRRKCAFGAKQRGRRKCAFGAQRRGRRKCIFGEQQEERQKCSL